MKNLLIIFATCAAFTTVADRAYAVPSIWGVWTWQHTEPVHIMVTPGIGGDPLTAAEFFGGAAADATIRIQLWGDQGDDPENPLPPIPVANFPREDIWLEAPGLAGCVGGSNPDNNTDADGWFTFSQPPLIGGWTDPNEGPPGISIYVSGVLLDDGSSSIKPPIVINSPDINGDLVVNLIDVPLFAADFDGSYSFRSDFHWDGVLNLSDVVRMATGLGAECP